MTVKEAKVVFTEKEVNVKEFPLKNSSSVYKFVKSVLNEMYNPPTEYLMIISINDDTKPVSFIVMGNSSEESVDFTISAILRFVILSGYSKFITIHNHPNNIAEFSKEDIDSTKRLKKAAELVNLELVGDYLIVDKKCIKNKRY